MADPIEPASGVKAKSEQSPPNQMTKQLDAKQRILEAVTYLTATRSHAESTLAELLTQAGVARATFYKYFADKRACLLAAERYHGQRLLEALEQDPQDPWSALVRFTRREPHALTILAEIQIPGEEQLSQHDQTRRGLAAALQRGSRGDLRKLLANLPPTVLAGAAIRVLAMDTYQPEPEPEAIAEHIGRWMKHYVEDSSSARWSELDSQPLLPTLETDWPSSSRNLEAAHSNQPQKHQKQEAQRQLILHAVVEATQKHGYDRSTVSDIAASAGVSREAFYSHFPDKATAFQTAHQTIFGDLMALCMRNFVQADEWPDKVWSGGQVFASFFASHPTLARFVFVDSLTSGPSNAKHQLYGYLAAFAVFLRPGAPFTPRMKPQPQTSAQLIANAIFELNYECVRAGRSEELPALLPFATYLVLAPFIGTTAANRFIERKLETLGALAG